MLARRSRDASRCAALGTRPALPFTSSSSSSSPVSPPPSRPTVITPIALCLACLSPSSSVLRVPVGSAPPRSAWCVSAAAIVSPCAWSAAAASAMVRSLGTESYADWLSTEISCSFACALYFCAMRFTHGVSPVMST